MHIHVVALPQKRTADLGPSTLNMKAGSCCSLFEVGAFEQPPFNWTKYIAGPGGFQRNRDPGWTYNPWTVARATLGKGAAVTEVVQVLN